MRSALLTVSILYLTVAALGSAPGIVRTHASFVTSVVLAALYGSGSELLCAPSAASAGAGLVRGLEAKGKHERYRCLGRGFPVASQLLALGEVDVLSRCSRHTSSGALPVPRCKPSAHARTRRNHVGRGISSPVVTHWVNR